MQGIRTIKDKFIRFFRESPDAGSGLAAVIFGLLFTSVKIFGDDYYNFDLVKDYSLTDFFARAGELYQNWTSRIIVDPVFLLITKCGKFCWIICMILTAFVLLKALDLLFNDSRSRLFQLFCITLLFVFPCEMFMSAGWIATTGTYFGPPAFGIMALVPVKKCLKNEKLKIPEALFYLCCLLYAANNEQMCIILLGAYAAAAVFVTAEKKPKAFVFSGLFIIILNIANVLLCPGNRVRRELEIPRWFPTFGMLDIADKADIGLSVTMHWLYARGIYIVILISALLTFFVWKKYRNTLFRCISMLPPLTMLFAGPLKNLLSLSFPEAARIAEEVDYYGTFTVRFTDYSTDGIRFAVFLFISFCICLEFILLNDTLAGLTADLTLLIFGLGSRVVMGFSPTVYVSGMRTFSPLLFCLITAGAHIFSNNIRQCSGREKTVIKYLLIGSLFWGMIEILCMAAVAGR